MKERNLNQGESNFDCRMLPGPQYNNETYRKAVLFLHTCELHLYSKYLHWFEDLGGIPFFNIDINSYKPEEIGYQASITFRYVDSTGGRDIKVIKIADSDITNISVYEEVEKELGNAVIAFKETLLNS